MLDVKNWSDWLGIQTCGDKELEKLVLTCRRWFKALQAKEEPRWLTILGPSGTGKTKCAARLFWKAVARFDWARTSYMGQVIYWPDFADQLYAGQGFAKYEDLKRWPVLLLDDIGAERDPRGFTLDKLNTLLGCRVGKWTIITANVTQERLEAMDPRIADRVIRGNNLAVTVNTVSYALRGKA